MDNSTWILIAAIAAAVVIVIAVIAVIAIAVRRHGAPARHEQRRMEAREARREAELKAAEADRLDADARLRAAAAEEKAAVADVARAEARHEAVLAEDDHLEAEAVARDAAETRARADRIDPDPGRSGATEAIDAITPADTTITHTGTGFDSTQPTGSATSTDSRRVETSAGRSDTALDR